MGTEEQAEPNGLSMAVSLPAPAMLSSDAGADAEAFDEESDLAESSPLSEQALRASGRTAAAARVTAVRRIRVFMVSLLSRVQPAWCRLAEGGSGRWFGKVTRR